MSVYNWITIGLALVAVAGSATDLRRLAWIAALMLDYAISVAYWRTGLPWGEVVAGSCDAVVCLVIYSRYRQRWELVVYAALLASLAINIYYLGGNLHARMPWGEMMSISQDAYGTLLDVLNWSTLLFIGGTGALQTWLADVLAIRHDSGVARAARALGSPRKAPPWYRLP